MHIPATIKPYKNRHLINCIEEIKATVLVVDDEPLNIEVMCGMLESKGLTCDSALNGPRALTLFQNRIEQVIEGKANANSMYKLVLLDFSMPVMDGPKVATRMRKMISQQQSHM